ncbi:MAG: hypothetical protein AAF915_04100 [Cyanobacteria bacterium P01_D01_bin.50]
MPLEDIKSCCYELIDTPVDSVVEWLPNAYKRDSHTLPQFYSLYAQWRNLRIRLNVKKSFLIDRDEELEQFGKLTEIDISRKVNYTDDVVESVKLSPSSSMILQKLYKCDFELISSRKFT